jgi:hypothetical protein
MGKLMCVICLLFLMGCSTGPALGPLEFSPTPQPVSYQADINRMVKRIGKPETPEVIHRGESTLYAFNRDGLAKLTARNHLLNYLRDLVRLQYEAARVYVQEINTLKKLAATQRQETIKYQELYLSERRTWADRFSRVLNFVAVGALLAVGL